MMGPRQVEQGVLFYNFSLDAHVPADHLLRSIDRFVDRAKNSHPAAVPRRWDGFSRPRALAAHECCGKYRVWTAVP